MYGPSGNQLVLFSFKSWCFPQLCLGKHQDSWKNKANCFPKNHTLVYIIIIIIIIIIKRQEQTKYYKLIK